MKRNGPSAAAERGLTWALREMGVKTTGQTPGGDRALGGDVALDKRGSRIFGLIQMRLFLKIEIWVDSFQAQMMRHLNFLCSVWKAESMGRGLAAGMVGEEAETEKLPCPLMPWGGGEGALRVPYPLPAAGSQPASPRASPVPSDPAPDRQCCAHGRPQAVGAGGSAARD